MIPQPLHPAVVHFPIVLVVMLPIVAVAALVVIHRGSKVRGAWLPVVAVAAVLSVSSWLAVRTGEGEEDVVEEVVSERAIHEHEEAAELFFPLTIGFLLLTAGGLAGGRVGSVVRPSALVAALFLMVAGYRVGHTGGELVYEYGAAAAYVDTDPGGREVGELREHDEDEEDDGRG